MIIIEVIKLVEWKTCLVCGYKGLEEPPYDELGNSSFEICSCCGFQFGLDDEDRDYSKEELYKSYREDWIKDGSKPFSESFPNHLIDLNGSLKAPVLHEQLKALEMIP